MALRERVERLVLRGPQQAFDDEWNLRRGQVPKQFPAERALVAESAAGVDVIALDLRLAVGDLRAEEPDVADVVLGAGVGAAGEMDVHWLRDLQPGIHVIGDRQGMRLRVARGELAAG